MVPPGDLEVDVRVDPVVFDQVEGMDVGELVHTGPSSIDDEHLLVREHHGAVTASGLRRGAALVLDLRPFGRFAVEVVDVIVGGPLVADTTVTAEDKDFVFEKVGCAVRSGLGGTDLGLGVLGLHSRALIWWLHPVEVG